MLNKIIEIETAEDKTRTQVVLALLDEALRLRDFQKGGVDEKQKALDELKDKCTTEIILQIAGHVGEILRYTFDQDKTKFSKCNSADDAKDNICNSVEQYMKGYLKESHD